MKHIWTKFGSSTSVHGIPHLISAKSLKLRMFWSIICLTSLSIFIFLLSKLIIKYYSYPVVVKISQVGFFFYNIHFHSYWLTLKSDAAFGGLFLHHGGL